MSMSKPFNTSSLLCEESVSASNSSGKPESSFRKDGGLEERNDELVSDNLEQLETHAQDHVLRLDRLENDSRELKDKLIKLCQRPCEVRLIRHPFNYPEVDEE